MTASELFKAKSLQLISNHAEPISSQATSLCFYDLCLEAAHVIVVESDAGFYT